MAGQAVRSAAGRLLPLVVGTIGLVACGALVLAFAFRHNLRLDLTPQRTYTLSSHARSVVRALDRDVVITAFVRSEDPRTPLLKDLLWRVAAESPRIRYAFVDLNRSPALAQRYGIDRYGALVIESGGRRRDVANPSEGLLVGALLRVTRDRERIVYFVTGHGEASPGSTDRKRGGSVARRALEDELFAVRELSLLSAPVPADATVVVIAGPRKDYLAEEIAHLEAYVARGGALLLLLEPETPRSVAALAARYGIVPLEQIVVDPERRLASGEGFTILVSGLAPQFPVTRMLEAPPVFSYARPLEVRPDAAGWPQGFLETGAAAFAVQPGAVGDTPVAARRGRLVLGAAVQPEPPGGEAGTGRPSGRLIVYGDADFATNGMIEYLGNKDLLVNSANWLVRDESLIAARAQEKERGREQLFVTATQGRMAFWLAAVVQPGVFLAAALTVFLRRRMR